MKVSLSHAGNPDIDYRGGYWEQPKDRNTPKHVHVNSFAEASRACTKYIERNGLGGGNWTGGQIYDDAGEQIAFVSYNGRVWEGTEYVTGCKEIKLHGEKV